MKKRSEVAALRNRSEAKADAAKPSAEERTVPSPIDEPEGSLHCDACEEDVSTKDVIRHDDKIECPNCGASIESLATPTKLSPPPGKPADKPTTSDRSDARTPIKDPENKWCAECGTEVTIHTDGTILAFPCGHGNAERIDDPRKAKRVKPAAGLQTRTFVEIEKRNAEDKARGVEARIDEKGRDTGSMNVTPPKPTITIEGDRMSVMWGKSTFPLAMMSNFAIGDFFVSVQLPPGADRVKVAREILADIEKIADEAFDRQRAWYEKKLGSLQ